MVIKQLLVKNSNKFTFTAEIIGGRLYLDLKNDSNSDIIDVSWVPLHDRDKFDCITLPLLNMMK